jgi:HEAT repeat protein
LALDDEKVRDTAIRALKQIGGEYAATALAEFERQRAKLVEIEPPIHKLKHGDIFERIAAARALGEIGDPRAVEPLKAALNDLWADVSEVAAWALGQIDSSMLPDALKDTRG